MERIKIEDLAKDMKVTKWEMRNVFGGALGMTEDPMSGSPGGSVWDLPDGNYGDRGIVDAEDNWKYIKQLTRMGCDELAKILAGS